MLFDVIYVYAFITKLCRTKTLLLTHESDAVVMVFLVTSCMQ